MTSPPTIPSVSISYARNGGSTKGNALGQQDLSKAKNPDLRASLAAMRRAAEMARSTAIQTDTDIVIVKDGKPVRVTAEELRQERRA